MIRINLLGQPRPRARRAAVPVGVALPISLLAVTLLAAFGFVGWDWSRTKAAIDKEGGYIRLQTDEKTRLEGVRGEVEKYEKQNQLLESRGKAIKKLDRNRTGGQELLDAVANTVTKSGQLWLTSMVRKGNTLTIEGTGSSMHTVANFITELLRSGYFQHVEIKESHQDERKAAVPAFPFSLTADFVLPEARKTAAGAGGNS